MYFLLFKNELDEGIIVPILNVDFWVIFPILMELSFNC